MVTPQEMIGKKLLVKEKDGTEKIILVRSIKVNADGGWDMSGEIIEDENVTDTKIP